MGDGSRLSHVRWVITILEVGLQELLFNNNYKYDDRYQEKCCRY